MQAAAFTAIIHRIGNRKSQNNHFPPRNTSAWPVYALSLVCYPALRQRDGLEREGSGKVEWTGLAGSFFFFHDL